MQHTRRAESLVNRLRKPLPAQVSIEEFHDKLNAISEALAYLVDKGWAKQKAKKARKSAR